MMMGDERCPACGSDRVSSMLDSDGDYEDFICHDCKWEWWS